MFASRGRVQANNRIDYLKKDDQAEAVVSTSYPSLSPTGGPQLRWVFAFLFCLISKERYTHFGGCGQQ